MRNAHFPGVLTPTPAACDRVFHTLVSTMDHPSRDVRVGHLLECMGDRVEEGVQRSRLEQGSGETAIYRQSACFRSVSARHARGRRGVFVGRPVAFVGPLSPLPRALTPAGRGRGLLRLQVRRAHIAAYPIETIKISVLRLSASASMTSTTRRPAKPCAVGCSGPSVPRDLTPAAARPSP